MKFKRMAEVDLRGKRVFIRADLNVPMEGGRITDDTRIRASLPGIKYALEQGAAVMVTSHLGRPKEGELKPEDSLAPVAARHKIRVGMHNHSRIDANEFATPASLTGASKAAPPKPLERTLSVPRTIRPAPS